MIERLRALEKRWRKKAENARREADWSRESGSFYDERDMLSRAETYSANADELAAILSARQEVAPVADERLCDFFADVGEVEKFMDDLCNVVTDLTGDEGEDDPITVLRRYVDSTGQTSDARDAKVAELIEATRRLTADIEFRIDDPRSQLLDRARRATTAAVGCDCPGSAKVSYLSHAPNCPAREALGKFAAMRQEGE